MTISPAPLNKIPAIQPPRAPSMRPLATPHLPPDNQSDHQEYSDSKRLNGSPIQGGHFSNTCQIHAGAYYIS